MTISAMTKITEFQGEHRFLSNFWPAPVVLNDEEYSTMEHAYQAAKSVNPIERAMIRRCATPGEAKRAGRRITIRRDWDQVKEDYMRELLRIKFSYPKLRQQLLATGDALIEEGNRWGDTFWGIDLRTGRGQNKLGRLLMAIRADLRAQDSPPA